jgi:uncharacterized protein (DUF1778 family)
MSVASTVRVTSRVPLNWQEKLQIAADIMGSTLNQFIVQSAMEKAEKVIENEQRLVLTERESLRLLELLDRPSERNEKFNQAMMSYQKIKNQ